MIKKRIIQLVEFKGIAKESFYKKIGMTSANFRGKASETPINSIAIENILSEVPDLNLSWLLTGKGEMLKNSVDEIFNNRIPLKTEIEKKQELFNSFGDINSGDERLKASLENIEKFNQMLSKENLLQEKVIEGLEFKIQTLQKELSELKYSPNESFLHRSVAEPAPELTGKKR